MSQKTVEYARDVLTWWNEHRAESGDLMRRIERLERAASELLSLCSFLLEDIHRLEGRPPEALGRRLWTPSGMAYSGDLKKFG